MAGFVQSTGSFASTSAANIAKAYTSPVTAGNLLWAGVSCAIAAASTFTVTDSQGNVWTAATAQASNATWKTQLFWAKAGSTGANTVTFARSGGASTDERVIGIAEFSGVPTAAPVDAANTGNGTSANPSVNVTVTAAAVLLTGHCTTTLSASIGAGFSDLGAQDGNGFEYKLAPSAGSTAVPFVVAASTWAEAAASFTAGASASAPDPLDPQIQWTEDFGPGEDFGPNPFTEDVYAVPAAQVFAITLSAAAGSSAVLVRQVNAIRSVTSAGVATAQRAAARVLAASSAGAAALVNRPARILAASTAGSATVAAVRVILASVSASSASSVALTRQVGKALAVSAGSSAVLVRQVGKVLAVSAGNAASVAATKVILATVSTSTAAVASVATLRARVQTLLATSVASAVLARQVSKTVSASSTGSASVSAPPPGGGGGTPNQMPTKGAG